MNCLRPLCSVCGKAVASASCDGEQVFVSGPCAAPLCARCSLRAGDRDFCPRHAHQARLQRVMPFVGGQGRRT